MTRVETLYAWLWRTFGARPFSVGEFEATFPSPRPHRTLSELKLRGFVERVGRGSYRVVAPERWAAARASLTVDAVERSLSKAPWPYAFTRGSAVRLWSAGRYTAGGTPGYHAVEVAVLRADVRRWKEFAATQGVVARLATSRGTAAGVEVLLHPRPKLQVSWFKGQPVEPKRQTLAFVRRNAAVFGPAEEMVARA